MSRRRQADADTAAIGDDLEAANSDLANGKQRSPADKAGRFFRTRPVSSLLLIILLCAAAMLTFSVGRALARVFLPSALPPPVLPPLPVSKLSKDRIDHTAHLEEHYLTQLGKAVHANDKGTKRSSHTHIDNHVSQTNTQRNSAILGSCHRKFEPGKLGSTKTLCVTDEFYFDISIGSTPAGRIVIGVFGEIAPKSAANFRALATCTGVFADEALCYKRDSFHRVVTNFVIQGGSKGTARSIYGSTFLEEKSKEHHSVLQHSEPGVVSWAEYPIGSQFFILLRNEAIYLDINHVVFGIVTEGFNVLTKIENAPREGEVPKERVTITDSGDVHKTVS